jgi:hypothetical protein
MADKNNRGKKGISPVIATVLLVSIVIVMGLIIFLVARNFIKEPVTKFGSSADDACGKLAGSLEWGYDGETLTIDNQDDEFTLYKISYINEDGDSTESSELMIMPGSSGDITVGSGITKFSPIIKGTNSKDDIVAYTCSDEVEVSSS